MISPIQLAHIIHIYLPEPESSLAAGIVLGIPLVRGSYFYTQIMRVGLLHMVVLSGTNITILGAIIGSILRFLPRILAASITVCAIVAFTVFVGPQAPIVRAAIMGILSQLAIITGRTTWALYILILSALIMMVFFPEMVMSVSFELSYCATLGIILFGQSKPTDHWLWREFKPSLAAQLATLPVAWLSFRQVSLVAPIANILVAWCVTPIMISTLLLTVVGGWSPTLGRIVSIIPLSLNMYVVTIIDILSRFPYALINF